MSTAEWGRADDDGTVWVRTADGERVVGQFPGATPQEALAYFGRKFDDLAAQVTLLEQRLGAGQVSPADALSTIQRLDAAVADANAVGDLVSLRTRLATLAPVAEEHRAQTQRARAEARAEAIATRNAIVAEAETLAEADPDRIGWKVSGDRLRDLFEQWRRLQREARLDKHTEDELWKRFSHARTTFDRKRRHYFGALDEQRAAARAEKEAIAAEAETLAGSTDWGATAAAFRDLMIRWKAGGRAAKKDDDLLWARFRAAQDAFFAARTAATNQVDAEFASNLAIKEALVVEAEALLPVTDSAAARAALREIQSRWDAGGKVARNDQTRIEARLRRVEQAIRDADSDRWRRTNPEAAGRAADAVAQLEGTIAGLERDLERARDTGNDRKARDVEQSLQARREWLAQARRALADFNG